MSPPPCCLHGFLWPGVGGFPLDSVSPLGVSCVAASVHGRLVKHRRAQPAAVRNSSLPTCELSRLFYFEIIWYNSAVWFPILPHSSYSC